MGFGKKKAPQADASAVQADAKPARVRRRVSLPTVEFVKVFYTFWALFALSVLGLGITVWTGMSVQSTTLAVQATAVFALLALSTGLIAAAKGEES